MRDDDLAVSLWSSAHELNLERNNAGIVKLKSDESRKEEWENVGWKNASSSLDPSQEIDVPAVIDAVRKSDATSSSSGKTKSEDGRFFNGDRDEGYGSSEATSTTWRLGAVPKTW